MIKNNEKNHSQSWTKKKKKKKKKNYKWTAKTKKSNLGSLCTVSICLFFFTILFFSLFFPAFLPLKVGRSHISTRRVWGSSLPSTHTHENFFLNNKKWLSSYYLKRQSTWPSTLSYHKNSNNRIKDQKCPSSMGNSDTVWLVFLISLFLKVFITFTMPSCSGSSGGVCVEHNLSDWPIIEATTILSVTYVPATSADISSRLPCLFHCKPYQPLPSIS